MPVTVGQRAERSLTLTSKHVQTFAELTGAATYIVTGKGDAEAYNTSPHGAGRLLGRNVARKALSVDEFKTQMAGKTWLDRDASKLLDEAPFAYKPIETVIDDSPDLIEPVAVLSQFINYKGL